MPPRVAYWLSSFDPDMEAVAGEVACLRRFFPGSIAWGVAPRNALRLSWSRGFGINPRFQLLFRAAVAAAQRFFDINHLFGSTGDWFHLRAVNSHPVVLTVATDQTPCGQELLRKVDQFVVEWPGATDRLLEHGVSRDRIALILPAVNLDRFRATPSSAGPFTVLFASSPDRADWLESRGVRLLLDAAALMPGMHFRLIWRPWGDSLSTVRQWVECRGLSNVEICVGRVADMYTEYQRAHVTIAPFLDRGTCKPAPQSLIESLACGRPVVVTRSVGIADMLVESGAGFCCDPDAAALAACLERARSEWDRLSVSARRTAENRFGLEAFVQSYRKLYESLQPRSTASVAPRKSGL